jgi:hypothetical protein
MSARDELAEVIADAIGDQFHDNGEYCRVDSLDDVCIDGYADLTNVADRILAAGFVKAGAAEALLEEIRALAARTPMNTWDVHYELRALLERKH